MIIHNESMKKEKIKVYQTVSVMQYLGLLVKKSDYAGGFEYVGPDINKEESEKLFELYKEKFPLKNAAVFMTKLKIPNLTELLPKIQKEPEKRSNTGVPNRESWDEEKIEEERQRSIKYKDQNCRCGGRKLLKNNPARSKVHFGFKKRSRCTYCVGCKAPKCMECCCCLKPHLKKPCVNKKCLYPVIPRCECFP